MFNDVVVVKSWHDLGAHLEKRGKKKRAPVTCEIRVFLIAIVRRLAINRSDIYRRIPRVGGYSIQRCRGTRATFNYHPTRSYCWKRGVNEAETIEWYER